MFGRVVPFEPPGETARFGRGEGRMERGGGVRAEIVLHQHDLRRAGKMRIGQIPERLGIVNGGVTIGDFHPGLRRGRLCRQPSSGANIMNRLATPLRSYS